MLLVSKVVSEQLTFKPCLPYTWLKWYNVNALRVGV